MRTDRMLPPHEGKMGHAFDHRYASFFGLEDTEILRTVDHSATGSLLPRYRVRPELAEERQKRRAWRTESAMLGSFDLVMRRDTAKYGEYRTERLILEAYDRLAD